ncbi:hypothetical protein ABHF33_01060 [Chitinibacter sp. FCG-7]|uniref:Uncharacterized protein n=1 Tax=Chitinibacter mangrovi TaxID=3153927 RepID=A0AAU7FAF0_9NEIS
MIFSVSLRETVNELNLYRGEHVGSTPYRVTHAQLAAQFESAGFLIQEIRSAPLC